MKKIFIGIDNGVSGSIGIINGSNYIFKKMPVKKQQNYTKAKAQISRIDMLGLKKIFIEYVFSEDNPDIMILLERPMVNPMRFKATTSALRALEAVLCFLESNNIAFDYIDSKEWQKVLLPKGAKGDELKAASLQISKRLFPSCVDIINKQKDGDGILIAEYCRRKFR